MWQPQPLLPRVRSHHAQPPLHRLQARRRPPLLGRAADDPLRPARPPGARQPRLFFDQGAPRYPFDKTKMEEVHAWMGDSGTNKTLRSIDGVKDVEYRHRRGSLYCRRRGKGTRGLRPSGRLRRPRRARASLSGARQKRKRRHRYSFCPGEGWLAARYIFNDLQDMIAFPDSEGFAKVAPRASPSSSPRRVPDLDRRQDARRPKRRSSRTRTTTHRARPTSSRASSSPTSECHRAPVGVRRALVQRTDPQSNAPGSRYINSANPTLGRRTRPASFVPRLVPRPGLRRRPRRSSS